MITAKAPKQTPKRDEKLEDVPSPEVIQLLISIDKKLDRLDARTEKIEARAITKGAIAGGVSGGIVATAIAIIQSKFGM